MSDRELAALERRLQAAHASADGPSRMVQGTRRGRFATKMARGALSLPTGVWQRLVGPVPVSDRGHKLDATLHRAHVLDQRLSPKLELLPPAKTRALVRRKSLQYEPSRVRMDSVTDRSIELEGRSLGVRLYKPRRAAECNELLVYFHGGGFVFGDLDVYDTFCRVLADSSGFNVASVDYRLAPEHKFPAAPDDALEAFRFIRDHAEEFGSAPGRIAVGGDSAGGNLAAVVCQDLEDIGEAQPLAQLLICPALAGTDSTASRERFADGPQLTSDLIAYFWRHYVDEDLVLDESAPESRRLAPMLGSTNDLAPAIVVTCGFDPLRDEAEEYADRLEASSTVSRLCFEDLMHGFNFYLGVSNRALEASEAIGRRLHEHRHSER